MGIERIDGFLQWEVSGHTSVGLESDQLDACVRFVRAGGFTRVFASLDHGFREESLSCLNGLPLEQVELWDTNVKDAKALYDIPTLARLRFSDKRPAIDFGRLAECLNSLSVCWKGRDSGLSGRALEFFHLWHHKPKSKSLTNLELPTAEEAEFSWTNATTLDGIGALGEGCHTLKVHYARGLTSLNGIETLPGLRRLIATASGNLKDTTALSELPSMELALVDGRDVLASPLRG